MHTTGISTHALIAVRSNPSERAEMVTQLLFGETFDIDEVTGNWARITIHADKYEGWIDKKLIVYLTEDEFHYWNLTPHFISIIPYGTIHVQGNQITKPLVAGSHLPINNHHQSFSIAGIKYDFPHSIEIFEEKRKNPIAIATQFLNAPYLWGGKSILGIDCSGLVQLSYSISGINLPRDASKQIILGETLNFTHESQPGDLAFFDNEMGDIVHVGLMVNAHEIIHASGFVRIDPIDHQGIFNPETKKYSHKLRIIKRITF